LAKLLALGSYTSPEKNNLSPSQVAAPNNKNALNFKLIAETNKP
jgi:hypothetical protein